MFYFIVSVFLNKKKEEDKYGEYIGLVKPIVEKYGGRYLARSNKVTALQKEYNPDRVVIIEWDAKEQLEACFSSVEYKEIAGKRENSVDSKAIIVEG